MNQILTYRSAATCHCLAGAWSNTFFLLGGSVLLTVGQLLEQFSFIFVSMALSHKPVVNEGIRVRSEFSDAFFLFTNGKVGHR